MVENKGEPRRFTVGGGSVLSLLSLNELWTAESDTTDINWCKWLWRIYGSAAGLRGKMEWGKEEEEEEEEEDCV